MEAKFLGGYQNQVLEIDLTNQRFIIKELDKTLGKNFIGGRGFTSKIQYDEISKEVDPLSEKNILVLATGPLTGTMTPGGGRMTVGAKSPLTGILGDSNFGGHWGKALKAAGYDVVILRGKLEKPFYLLIHDQKIEFHDARDLWGKGTCFTTEALQQKHGKDFRVLTIGQAGENLVPYAAIISELNAAGRTGMGAVLGSKKLKAILLRGTRTIKVANPEKLRHIAREILQIVNNDPICSLARKYGTLLYLSWCGAIPGGLAFTNWRESWIEGWADQEWEKAIVDQYLVSHRGCFSCPIRCSKILQIQKANESSRPTKLEFVTAASLGRNLQIYDPEYIIKATELCNDFGLDTLQTAATIACAIECYQNGIIDRKVTGELDLQWGHGGLVLKLIRQIAFREGLGTALAEGLRNVGRCFGKRAEKYAVHVKGMAVETSMDPRVYKVYGSRSAVSSRGACHMRSAFPGGMNLDEKPFTEGVKDFIQMEKINALTDMMGICKLFYGAFSESVERAMEKVKKIPELYSAVTGIETDWEALMLAAERVQNVERQFNLRQGLTKAQDRLPKRFTEDALTAPNSRGAVYDLKDSFLNEYYAQKGWTREGKLRKGKLKELEIREENH